jgi:hypothetical protein
MSKTTFGLSALFDTGRRQSIAERRAENVRVALALPFDDPQTKKLTEHPLVVTKLSVQDRAHLLLGPKISVVADNNVIIRKDVPLRALTVSSRFVHDLLQIKPDTTEFRVTRMGTSSKVDDKSIEHLLDLLTTQSVIDANGMKLESASLINNILMYQACIALGIHNDYVLPLLRKLKDEVSARLLTVDERNTIINRVRATDPLMKHLAHNLCYRRINKKIDDIKGFEEWLAHKNRKKLQEQMVVIDQVHKKRRADIKHLDSWRGPMMHDDKEQ